MTMGADDVIDAFYRAYNAHDVGAASRLYTPDGWHEDVATGRRRRGAADLETGLAKFFAFIPDVRWTERERIVAKTSVAVWYTMDGHVGAPGKPVSLTGLHVFDLVDAAIAASRDYWNPIQFQRQLS